MNPDKHHINSVLERLILLERKLEYDGSYVDSNTVFKAIDLITVMHFYTQSLETKVAKLESALCKLIATPGVEYFDGGVGYHASGLSV
jgi:hypothetical protein